MEEILVLFQDPRIIVPLVGTCLVLVLIAIAKKAFKIGVAIFLCGMAIALIKPTTTQLMAKNGISIQGTVLTINTQTEQKTIDLAMGTTLDTKEQSDGSYQIIVTVPDNEQYVLSISKSAATWIEFGAKFINELEKTGEDAVHQTLGMIRRW